jgi:succinate dehydrogenase/fumarate reductase flavoprotein subunit
MKASVFVILAVILLFAAHPMVKANVNTSTRDDEKKETKKEKEKEKEKKKQKVITNEDLKNITGVNITFVVPEPQSEDKTKKTTGAKEEKKDDKSTGKEEIDPKQTEKYWRDRMNNILANIKRNEDKLKEMREKLTQLQDEYPRTDILSERLRMENEINQLFESIKNYESGLEKLKKDLEDLEDEARKAGVSPGWLR